MPKMKTVKTAAKRFSLTGTGKLKRAQANKNHKLGQKTAKRKRNLRKGVMTDATNVKQMKRMIPYL